MSRPVDINLTSSNAAPPTPTEIEEFATRMIQVLDRGHIIDRFHVSDLPAGTHIEWHKDDPVTHARLTAKGFVVDDALAKRSSFIHTDGTGSPRIADVRLYSIPKWKHEILEKIETEKGLRAQDPRRADRDFMSSIQGTSGLNSTISETTDNQVSFSVAPTTK
jgi:hypothetical protein